MEKEILNRAEDCNHNVIFLLRQLMYNQQHEPNHLH